MSRVYHFFIISLRFVLILTGIAVASCGGGGGSSTPLNVVNATYVNSVSGSDISGTGAESNPYKTISHALAAPGRGPTIVLSPGEYNATSGETFPIVLPPGLIIRGSGTDISSGIYSRISGGGTFYSTYLGQSQSAAVEIQHGGGVGALVVESPGGVGVWDESDGSQAGVVSCLVQSSQQGIVIVGMSTAELKNNVIQGNISSGIQVLGNSTPTLIQNTM